MSGPDDQNKGTIESRAEAELRVEMQSTIKLLEGWIDSIQAETRDRNHADLSADFENLLQAYQRLCTFSSGLGAPNRATRSMDELRDFRHELRTPLTVIMGYCKMLGQEAQTLGLRSIVENCEKITQETRRLVAAAAVPLFRRFQSTGELQVSQLAQLAWGHPWNERLCHGYLRTGLIGISFCWRSAPHPNGTHLIAGSKIWPLWSAPRIPAMRS